MKRSGRLLIGILLSGALALSCSAERTTGQENSGIPQRVRYVVVKPGTHPSLLFSRKELAGLKQKARGEGLAREMWDKIKSLSTDWTMRGEWANKGMEIDAKALIYQVEGDKQAGREALDAFKQVLDEIEPHQYYFEEVKSDFFETENWPKAFAFAYDWLYDLMTDQERKQIVEKLELWCKALYEHTESWWWRDASYNCGAIPVGALGLLCTAIQADAHHPEFNTWMSSALERIRDNYFPTAWRLNGICYEGPCYAHYHKNATMFGEALRRNGGPDIISTSGAVNAMHYQRFQWMPQGGCGPVGDNTEYGRRVFQEIYLFGIGEMNDQAGLWTYEKYTDRDRLNPIISFIFYPLDVKPVSPGTQDLTTSFYFEITPNQAGYVYSRSEWDNERAPYFAFVTRYAGANHQHYDMNTFLFMAFGEEFATHANIYSYSDSLHGADIEHNIVIIDEGGMPLKDNPGSAGDDCSVRGYMTGVGLGHFADYVRGDASLSYKDRSVPSSTPAVRADRCGVFVKQGPNPYVIMVDDIQKSEDEDHDYHWQWFCRATELSVGKGTLDDPFIIPGAEASCAVALLAPETPDYEFKVARGGSARRPLNLGLIRVNQRGKRVRYFSIGAAWEKDKPAPKFRKGPQPVGGDNALSLIVEGDGFTDLILWQPEEIHGEKGVQLSCGGISSNGFLTVVRTDSNGEVTGYVLGDGSKLVFGDRVLVEAEQTWSVSADKKRVFATGMRKAREGEKPLPAIGKAWLPADQVEVFADGVRVKPVIAQGRMASIGG